MASRRATGAARAREDTTHSRGELVGRPLAPSGAIIDAMASIGQVFPSFAQLATESGSSLATSVLEYPFDPRNRTSIYSTCGFVGALATEQAVPLDKLVGAAAEALDVISNG